MDDDTTGARPLDWLLLLVKVPANPSRYRVAVWRELRKIGAVPTAPGVWALPVTPECVAAADRVVSLAKEGDGEVMLLDARGHGLDDATKLLALFSQARIDDWTEFLAECANYEAEIAKEIAKDKLTMAELEEEEQSLDRLRRWQHDLSLRDVFGSPLGEQALTRLQDCGDRLDEYAEMVYSRTQQA